jgi:hypothetical protein
MSMTPRKKVTDQAKPPTKRARKKAKPELAEELNLQRELISEPAPAQSSESDSSKPPETADNEAGQRIDPAPDRSEAPVDSTKLPASPPVPAHPGLAPEGELPVPSEAAAPSREQVDIAAQTWLLATNHLNLLYMLAAGMLMGPAGFGGKHYRDPSSEVPGLIPIFRGVSPETAIQQTVSEQKHLRACLAEIDLVGLTGPARLISHDGTVRTGTLPLSIDSKTAALLVPAPLPITLVTRLVFRSAVDRKEFQASASNFANIDLTGLNIEVDEQLFSSARPMVWPLHGQPQDTKKVVVDQPLARGGAIGGIVAILYQLANRSDLCCSAYRVASGSGVDGDLDAIQLDPVLAELGPWIESGGPRGEAPVQARLYWGAVQALVDARRGGSTEGPVDIVLGFLEGQITEVKGTGHQPRLERLISDMRSTFGLGGGTVSQLFERHKGGLSRPVLLFCLRERCADLLEFSHPDLRDEELVLAAILFGVRDGWIGLPIESRTPKALSQFVEHRMFEVEGSERGSQLSLDPAPPRPIPLRELLSRSEGSWNEGRSASLAEVASRLGWDDCLVSRVNLSPGQYRLNVSSDGIEVVVRGSMSPPVVEIDWLNLRKRISQLTAFPRDAEGELRAALDPRAQS